MEEKEIDQKAIRTYESDIANSIQHRHTSQVSMVTAEEDKKHQQEIVQQQKADTATGDKIPENKIMRGKNILMILVSLVLLAAGTAIAYYFYVISPLSIQQPVTLPMNPSAVTITSVITPDLQKIIDITGKNAGEIIQQIEKESQTYPLSDGGILEIVLGTQASTTPENKTTLIKVTGTQFISMIGLTPPNALTSALTDQWMLGFYSSGTDSAEISSTPFIIATDNFFQNAFAGMLQWEPTMPSQVSGLFGIQPTQWSGGSFQDKVIQNKDSREFVDSSGNVLFLYSFIDNNTLVMAQNEAALGEIIHRFESRAYIR